MNAMDFNSDIYEGNSPCTCDDCGKTHKLCDLGSINDAEMRIEIGGEVPAGECPDCGALAYVDSNPRMGRYISSPAAPIKTNPRLYSFLIAWNDNDSEEGTYGWTGEADSRDAAMAAAYEEMWSTQAPHDGEEFYLQEFSDGRRIIEEWHGTNPWAMPAPADGHEIDTEVPSTLRLEIGTDGMGSARNYLPVDVIAALNDAAGALASLNHQVDQMRGMLSDEDGTIEGAVQDGYGAHSKIAAIKIKYGLSTTDGVNDPSEMLYDNWSIARVWASKGDRSNG